MVEDVGGLGTPTVAAHEMSHSLGAFHDGSGESENCSVRQNFMMAPMSAAHPFDAIYGDTFPNAFRLSECSLHQIQDFLNSSNSNCLWASNTKPPLFEQQIGENAGMAKSRIGAPKIDGEKENGPKIGTDEFEEDEGMIGEGEEEWNMEIGIDWKGKSSFKSERRRTKPGERFHPSRQCQIAFGPNYGLCQRRDFLLLSPDPCRRLWCKDRRQRRWTPCETKGFLPMMDGTRCGQGKWCIRGQCRMQVARMLGKRANENEKNNIGGMDGTFEADCIDLNGPFCANFEYSQLRSFCPISTFGRLCCASCHRIPGKKKGQKMVTNGNQ